MASRLTSTSLLRLLADCTGAPASSLDGGLLPINESPQVKRHTPRWAFEPWISQDISTAAETADFVAGFELNGEALAAYPDRAALEEARSGSAPGDGHFTWLRLPASEEAVVVSW